MYKCAPSFLGSFLFVRGVSVFLGGYPNEIEIYNMVSSELVYPKSFYLNLFVIVFFTVLQFLIEKERSRNTFNLENILMY